MKDFWYAGLSHEEADRLYAQITQAAIDWQFLTVKAGGMARKSDLDAWLMQRFGLDATDARGFSNRAEQHRDFAISAGRLQWIAGRPEPQWGDINAEEK